MRLPLLTALALSLTVLLPQDEEETRPAPEVGKPAPALRLNDHTGQAVSIGGAAEHWTVLAFYPKALTGG